MRSTSGLLVVLACAAVAGNSQTVTQRNLQTCLSGKYPALCDHASLTPDQAKKVREAERIANLAVCATGRYPALCNHSVLSPNELARIQAAETSQNLKTCMDGRYPAICNHSLLTPDQSKTVAAAEMLVASARPATVPRVAGVHRGQAGNCESGLSISSVEGDGKIIKLDDGSIWEIDDVDTVDTALWLPPSDVIVCVDKIINIDDDETAEATLIQVGRSVGTNSSRSANRGYEIEASANDETFVINGVVFKAKTYCFNFNRGDRVLFVDGSPLGACASATLLNLSTDKTCEVWCE